MYHQVPTTAQRKNSFHGSGPASGRRTARNEGVRRQERVRLLQLLVCLLLFLAVFLGKGVFPGRMVQLREELGALLSSDTDFRAAFSQVGEALSGEGTIFSQVEEFCVEVFGASDPEEEETPQAVPQLAGLFQTEQQFLNRDHDQQSLSDHFMQADTAPLTLTTVRKAAETDPEPTPEPEPAVAAVGALLVKSGYSGQPLPEKYTMDQLSLGDLETTTPVLGHINSIYGYRDHPINGKYQFHGGVDIGGQTGDPIAAFAAGTVEYVGEDDSYGLYLQLDHGNGVKSFYAHCQSICVKKGQSVTLGEKIGTVGSSGSATGPHLHLELKCQGTHVDPIYYIDFLSDQ